MHGNPTVEMLSDFFVLKKLYLVGKVDIDA